MTLSNQPSHNHTPRRTHECCATEPGRWGWHDALGDKRGCGIAAARARGRSGGVDHWGLAGSAGCEAALPASVTNLPSGPSVHCAHRHTAWTTAGLPPGSLRGERRGRSDSGPRAWSVGCRATSRPRALGVVSCPVRPTETAGGAGPATGAVLAAQSLGAALHVSPGPGHRAESLLTHQAWHLPPTTPARALPAHEGHPSLPLAPRRLLHRTKAAGSDGRKKLVAEREAVRPQHLKQHFILREPRKRTCSFNPESTSRRPPRPAVRMPRVHTLRSALTGSPAPRART